MTDHRANYEPALFRALQMLEMSDDLEITSALKQAASDEGIPYGDEMGKFVAWANKEIGL
jgi:hypothetical protein